MTHRRIVIGDVHGHYNTLMALLDAIAPASDDPVYFLGDLVDRGPESAKVVQFVRENNYRCLLGNHEQMLLDVTARESIPSEMFQGWLHCGGYSTLLSYQNNIPQDHLDWMKTLPRYLDLGDVWLVHAGVDPTLSLEQQTENEFCWIRDEFHTTKKPYFTDKLIIVGHTITFTFPQVLPGYLASGVGWLDIDTGAYHHRSGWLTGLDLTHKIVYQVNSYTGNCRQMPLEEIVIPVDPQKIYEKRLKILNRS
ncbi:metallophosphoesterase [Gloeothece citriformis PCC 7424]|uniref:Metallophosphoesterase n=1 Tax=Gloeothece citriformis (strain PCC 7424) TaxID=65393 RepID=B7KKZ2_GLOC7|nr:metallophosphoesterase family protein [Gloeothece citriformis]ACK72364.1 metallophosphoesterase [Gloeothece citriformis PCC 7424]